MQWDAEDRSARARHRDAELRRYVAGDLGRFTPFYRRHFAECRVDPKRVRGLADLSNVRPITWDDVRTDPGAFVVQPDRRGLARHGDRRLVMSMLAAWFTRRFDAVNRSVIEPRYKPVLWIVENGVGIGYTDADLVLLARAGSRVMSLAGLDRSDVVVGLTEAGPHLAHWQLVLGARAAGVAAVHLGPRPAADAVAAAAPSALAGSPDALLAALASLAERGLRVEQLRTLLVVGADPDPAVRDALVMTASDVTDASPSVVASWAPPGARVQWGECRDGEGFHTFPDLEVIEVGRGGGLHTSGPGELIWSAIGWCGTTWLRLLTGSRAEVTDGTCAACRRQGPMVVTGTRSALGVLATLRGRDDISAFQVEVGDRDGETELVVFLALARGSDLIDVLDDVDESLDATQYVVLSKQQVESRIRRVGSRVSRPS